MVQFPGRTSTRLASIPRISGKMAQIAGKVGGGGIVLPETGVEVAVFNAGSLDLNDSDEVANFTDVSGNGHDLTILAGSPTFKENAINGIPSVSCGVSDALQNQTLLTDTSSFSLFIVWIDKNIINADRSHFDSYSTTNRFYFQREDFYSGHTVWRGTGGGQPSYGVDNTFENWNITEIVTNGAGTEIITGGVSLGTNSAKSTQMGGLTLNSSNSGGLKSITEWSTFVVLNSNLEDHRSVWRTFLSEHFALPA